MDSRQTAANRFQTYAWIVLGYTALVIMWGAYVRATGSGAGCGEHWPMCNGEVIPRTGTLKTLIEFSHRMTSGLSLVAVVGLVIGAFRVFPKGHPSRRGALWSLGFIFGEAAVGAGLVMLSLVANNTSALRAVVIAAHLVNTFLLLFWMTYTARQATLGQSQREVPVRHRMPLVHLGLCMVTFVLIGAAGAIVALGDTLFPAKSLAEGFAQDFAPTAHFLIQLRIYHPMIAVLGTGYVLLEMLLLPRLYRGYVSRGGAAIVALLMATQVAGGVLNWMLLAPVWMQMAHLLLADGVWISLCLLYMGTWERVCAANESSQSLKGATAATTPVLVVG